MNKIWTFLLDVQMMDKLAQKESFIHRLDARCKIILTLFFTIIVISFDSYKIEPLLPFFAFPLFVIIAAHIPVGYVLKKILVVSLFALIIGGFNPILDKHIIYVDGYVISAGWLSFISIFMKFILTSSVAILLLLTTGMYRIVQGLEQLGVPKLFAVQLLFLYRYLFLISDEAERLSRARAARSFGKNGFSLHVATQLLSTLFIRSFERAERVYLAMKCRGFDGTVRAFNTLSWQNVDTVIFLFGIGFILFFKWGVTVL
jgi:cobalt/nickel transport system permease protein